MFSCMYCFELLKSLLASFFLLNSLRTLKNEGVSCFLPCFVYHCMMVTVSYQLFLFIDFSFCTVMWMMSFTILQLSLADINV